MAAGLVQGAQDAQVVLRRGGGFATEQRKLKVVSRAGARAVRYNEQRNTALNEQRAIPIRDFKSHRTALKNTLIHDH